MIKNLEQYPIVRTETEIGWTPEKLIRFEERIVEIAEMLSGKDISDSALNHAKALLN